MWGAPIWWHPEVLSRPPGVTQSSGSAQGWMGECWNPGAARGVGTGGVWAVAAASLQLHKREKTCRALLAARGEPSPGLLKGRATPPHSPPLARLSPWGDLVTAGDPWGHPAPTPGPGLVSKPLGDVCSPGSFSADFLSHGPSALGALAEGAGTAPRATQRPLRVTQRPLRVTQRPHRVTQRAAHHPKVPSPGDS